MQGDIWEVQGDIGEMQGTRGSSRTESSGSAPAAELLEVRSQPVAAALARASEVSSLCVIG